MKILYIGAFRFPRFDAAAARVLNNAKALRLSGHDVSFISWGGEYITSEKDKLIDEYYHDGFKYVITNELDPKGNILSKITSRIRRGNISLKILKNMNPQPDLIIMYNADYFWTKRMLRYCDSRHIKLANDITEWYDNNEIYISDIIPNYINMHCLQRNVKNKILISSFLKEYYPESNNILIPPLCDPEETKWSVSLKEDLLDKYEGITLIYAGKPAKKDCVHTVINAVNTLANEGCKIRFIILGITKEIYIKNYKQMLMTTSLHENIIFLGRVSQDLIPAYYRKADFMILLREPTRKNMAGFPTKFAESMTAGIPVITNLTSDLNQFVHEGENGFVIPGFCYEEVLSTLRSKVISLSIAKIAMMKEKTKRLNAVFDYKSHMNSVELFLKQLR